MSHTQRNCWVYWFIFREEGWDVKPEGFSWEKLCCEMVDGIGDMEIHTVGCVMEDVRIVHMFSRIGVGELKVGSIEEDILLNDVRGRETEYGRVVSFGRNVNTIAIKALVKMIGGTDGERFRWSRKCNSSVVKVR